ncbi:MAG TPA: sensor histidine kinase [Gammaproteobacteria bacterium]|nr:sensor histidine kinase [Gammaproteobacteria bacterium]
MMRTAAKTLRLLKSIVLGIHHRLLPPNYDTGWLPYLWLTWAGFYFVSLIPPTTTTVRIATLAALTAFFPLYFRYYWADSRERRLIIVLIAVLGVALTPLNAIGGGLLIYAGSFAGYSFKPRKALAALAALIVIAVIEYLWLDVPLGQWIWVPTFILMAGLANIWAGERERQNCLLRQSREEVRRLAATAERERIARDLHDLLGHTLTLITVKAELAGTLAARDLPRAAEEIRELEAIARDALAQVRQAVGGYRGDLAGEIANAGVALRAAGIAYEAETATADAGGAEQDAALAMVVREAVTNIVRHAGARACRLSFRRDDGWATLEISDDGSEGRHDEGNGIRGMRERLQALGGTLAVEFGATGTSLYAAIPVQEAETFSPQRVCSGKAEAFT